MAIGQKKTPIIEIVFLTRIFLPDNTTIQVGIQIKEQPILQVKPVSLKFSFKPSPGGRFHPGLRPVNKFGREQLLFYRDKWAQRLE